MNQKLLDYSRLVSVMAQQDVLGEGAAMQFCQQVLPQLLAALDVMLRLQDDRITSAIEVPAAPPKECEATVCSSRWSKKKKDTVPAKQAKKARKKPRARKPKHDSADA